MLSDEEEIALLKFERAWETGVRPDLRAAVPPGAGVDFLIELIHIDLERRVRAQLTVDVDAYLAAFPLLVTREEIRGDLLSTEHALRQRFQPASTMTDSGQSSRSNHVLRGIASAASVYPTVPGYSLVRVVGTGGMSVVYEAIDCRSDDTRHERKRVAIKLIKAGILTTEEARQRFRQEVRVLSQLRHVNVVDLIDAGTTPDGHDYLVMEYLAGGPLADTVRGPDEAARLVETLARAVGYFHQHKIVHRDLKPSNVLLADDGRALKIADFGLAKCIEAGTGTTTEAVGTPLYMPPEQVFPRLAAKVGPASDVYALGVLLYRVLTGVYPVPGLTPETLGRLQFEDPIPVRRHNPLVPAALETICAKSLERQPSRRYANGDELADDLARYRRHQRTVARPVSLLGQWSRRAERNPVLAATVGVLAVTLLTAACAGGYGTWKYTTDLKASKRAADHHRKIALDNMRSVIADIRDLQYRRPELDDLRQDLLIRFQTHMASILDDPAHLEAADETDFWLAMDIGDVYRDQQHDQPAARVHYQRALAIIDHLRTRGGGEADSLCRRLRSFVFSHIGDTQRYEGSFDEARKSLEEMFTLRDTLHAERPNRVTRADLAGAHLKLGDLAVADARLPRPDPHYLRCHELYRGLAEEFPEEIEYARMFGLAWDRLANMYRGRQEWAAAIQASEDGLRFRRAARDRFPRCELAFDIESTYLLDCLGYVYQATGEFSKIREGAEKSLQLRSDLVKRNPRSRWFKACVAQSYELMGDSWRGYSEFERAISCYEHAYKIHHELVTPAPASYEKLRCLIGCLDRLFEASCVVDRLHESTLRYGDERIDARRRIYASNGRNEFESKGLFDTMVEQGDYHFLCSRRADAARYYRDAIKFGEQAREIDWDRRLEEVRCRLALCEPNTGRGGTPARLLLGFGLKPQIMMRLNQEFAKARDHEGLARISGRMAEQRETVLGAFAAARGFAQAASIAGPGPAADEYKRLCGQLVARLRASSEEMRARINADPILARSATSPGGGGP